MSVSNAYVSGIPDDVQQVIRAGLESMYSDFSIVTLDDSDTRDKMTIRNLNVNQKAVLVVFSQDVAVRVSSLMGDLVSSKKYHEFSTVQALVDFLVDAGADALALSPYEMGVSNLPDPAPATPDPAPTTPTPQPLGNATAQPAQTPQPAPTSTQPVTSTTQQPAQQPTQQPTQPEPAVTSPAQPAPAQPAQPYQAPVQPVQSPYPAQSGFPAVQGFPQGYQQGFPQQGFSQPAFGFSQPHPAPSYPTPGYPSDFMASSSVIESLKSKVAELESSNADLKSQVTSLSTERDLFKSERDVAQNLVESTKSEYESYQQRVSEELEGLPEDFSASMFNSLSDEVEALRLSNATLSSQSIQNSSRLEELEEFFAEHNTPSSAVLQSLTLNPNALPQGIKLPDTIPDNVMFAYAGAKSSIRNAYRKMKTILEAISTNSEVLLLDVSGDSSADYYFNRTEHNLELLNWLSTGNNMQGAIASYTKNSKIKYMSLHAGSLVYFNELSVLGFDWSSRISELISLGIPTIIFVGDVSSYVGRSFLVSSSKKGIVNRIYVNGDGTSLRTAYTTLNTIPSTGTRVVEISEFIPMPANDRVKNSLSELPHVQVKIDSIVNSRKK